MLKSIYYHLLPSCKHHAYWDIIHIRSSRADKGGAPAQEHCRLSEVKVEGSWPWGSFSFWPADLTLIMKLQEPRNEFEEGAGVGIFLHIFRQSQPVSCSSLCHNELLGMDLYWAALQTWQFSNNILLMLYLIWNFLMLHQRFFYTLQLNWSWLVSINFPRYRWYSKQESMQQSFE